MADSDPRKKTKFWTDEEVKIIFDVYRANMDKIGFGKKFKNKIKLFDFIASQLKQKFGIQRTARMVADKVKNMRQAQKFKNRANQNQQGAKRSRSSVRRNALKPKPKVEVVRDSDGSEAEEWLEEELPVVTELMIERVSETENCQSSDQTKYARWEDSELDALRSIYNANINNVGIGKLFRTKTKLYDYISEQILATLGSKKTQQNIAAKIKNINYYYRVIKPTDSAEAIFQDKPDKLLANCDEVVIENINDWPKEMDTLFEPQTQTTEVVDAVEEIAVSDAESTANISDFEWPEPTPKNTVMKFWNNDEINFVIKLYDANAEHVGQGFRFKTKAQLYAYIAEKMKSIGSNKTAGNVSDKVRNMNAKFTHYKKKNSEEGNDPNETILQKYENLRNWDDDEVSFLMSTYNANANNIGIDKKYTTKMQLWNFVAAELKKKFNSNKTASNVAKKFQNLTKSKPNATSTCSIREWTPEESTFMLTLYCESEDDFENREDLHQFIAAEMEKNFALVVTAKNVQDKYNHITSQGKALYDKSEPADEEDVRKCSLGGTTKNTWSAEETKMMMSMYTENIVNIGAHKMYKTKRDFYEYLAKQMTMQLDSTKTARQISDKLKNTLQDMRKKKTLSPHDPIQFHQKYNRLLWSDGEAADLQLLYRRHIGEVGPFLRFPKKESLWAFIANKLSEKYGVRKTPRNAFHKYKNDLKKMKTNTTAFDHAIRRQSSPPRLKPMVDQEEATTRSFLDHKLPLIWRPRETQFLLDARKKIETAFKPQSNQMWDLVAVPLNKFFKNNRTPEECQSKYMRLTSGDEPAEPEDVYFATDEVGVEAPSPAKRPKLEPITVCSLCEAETECVDVCSPENKELSDNIFLATGIRFKKKRTGACPNCVEELNTCLVFRQKVQRSYTNACNSIDIAGTAGFPGRNIKQEIRFTCDKCGKAFRAKEYLAKHLSNNCSIRCTKCSEHFFNESFLENHMKTAHPAIAKHNIEVEFLEVKSVEIDPLMDQPTLELTAETEHKCLDCDAMFQSDIKLMAHKLLKHSKKMTSPLSDHQIICVECKPNVTFINRNYLQAHNKLVHKK